jgi:beta-fructofuranosidase
MEVNQFKVIPVTNHRYRLKYHFSAPSGWMNDPNGLAYFKGFYHVFYQYYPYDSSWGPMHWGHARSKDLLHWENLPVALVPGDIEDEDGCFSGSAIVKDNKLFLIYTGHHYYDKNDQDNFWQNQNIAISEDGIHFKKYEKNPVISNPPSDNTQHFRDPKVWEHDGIYYLIVGSQNSEKLGRILLYKSKDLLNWQYNGVVTVAKNIKNDGFMWECPDLFRLNGRDILLFSPQGIERQKNRFLNLYQTGYFIGKFNYLNSQLKHGSFEELDKGHDFYATQTFIAPDGRRILFGWMDMWEASMPEKRDGWAGALTLPRELILHDSKIYMLPVSETKSLRRKKVLDQSLSVSDTKLDLSNTKHLEINLQANFEEWLGSYFEVYLKTTDDKEMSLTFNTKTCLLTLFRSGPDPYRYGKTLQNKKIKIRIFIDTSSVEFFINDGEVVFSERFYYEGKMNIYLCANEQITVNSQIYDLK